MDQTNSQQIEIWERINREDVRANKDKIFLFGDNLTERGSGGQAKEMRGEENSRGIPTKKEPNNKPTSFFTDKEFASNKKAFDKAFGKIPNDKTLVIPKAGLGTGLAQLSENAPQTFAYLNGKFAEIGFDNLKGQKILPAASKNENKVVIQNVSEKPSEIRRLLDLNNIQTPNLQLLSPTEKEIHAINLDRKNALTEYADRLRWSYKTNKENLRDGFKLLSDSIDKGEQITVTCSCRSDEMCHADVVKMAVEKVNLHVKTKQAQEADRIVQNDKLPFFQKEIKPHSQIQEVKINPRTQRAINEILAFSENDRTLEKINQTDGRNRSEQASYLGKTSQFVRDIYERGANIVDGNLIVPQEKLSVSQPLAITTQDYAVNRIGKILSNESKAKEIAPVLVEYGNKIAGEGADGETRLKVFNWIYESLEGKTDFLGKEDDNQHSKSQKFDNTLENIRSLAEEMHSLEPTDKLEFVPLSGFEQYAEREIVFDQTGENLNLEEIYETAISREESGTQESFSNDHQENEQINSLETEAKINTERFERIELSGNVPQLPEEFTEREITRLLTKILPEIDRQIESGISQKEILKPYNEIIWQSKRDDALNQLEKIYQKQKITELDKKLTKADLTADQKEQLASEMLRVQAAVLTPTQEELRELLLDSGENVEIIKSNIANIANSPKSETIAQLDGKTDKLSQNIQIQLDNIDLRRHNIIELNNPGEYRLAEQTAVSTFFRKSKQEIGNLLEKLDEIRATSGDGRAENSLKKELSQIKDSKPSIAFKLENSSEIIVGEPSAKAIQERIFVSSYIDFQMKQPESRLRFESERYRHYAAKLESASSREEVIKTAGEIRIENAAIGLNWKDLDKSNKEKQPRPLSNKEMQFLFTENSPKHYTSEMTATRLSFAHSGESRRLLTESLMKREIIPSPEASKLIESLESRLERRDLQTAISATKHFFESLKIPNESLKYKNDFDHREIYRKLPPQEKDFVYKKTEQQKENLEYRLFYNSLQLIKTSEKNLVETPKAEISKTEKSFHLLSQYNQARILGEKIESSTFTQKEINERDVSATVVLLKNQSPEKIELIAQELRQSGSLETKKIGEVLETFSKAEVLKDENKTVINITLPENRLAQTETYRELLEKFYPDDERENDQYKLSSFGEKTLDWAREKGQDETVRNWREETLNNTYKSDVSANIFEVEQKIVEKFDKIKQFQQEARHTKRENVQLLEKYSRRAAAKIEGLKLSVPEANQQKEIVAVALGGKNVNSAFNQTNDQFLQTVQNEITISDFQKFTANEKSLSEIKTNINSEFAEILHQRNVLEESRFKSLDVHDRNENLQQTYQNIQQREENRLLTDTARKTFANGANLNDKTIGDLVEKDEKAVIRLKALTKARITLEPELKSTENKEYNEQALKMADAIEKAHELNKQEAPAVETAKAFEVAESEKTVLNKISVIEQSENKPLSLRIFENEIKRAEKQLFAKSLSKKLVENKNILAGGKLPYLETLFPPQEREEIKLKASEVAKDRLEPKELDADHRKVSTEASQQALTTFKQLEQATNIFQTSNDSSKINESFSQLDREAVKLKQIRESYNRTEKLALLKDGIKSDIVDLLRKNPILKNDNLVTQTNKILNQNFEKMGLIPENKNQIVSLSKELSAKIDAKQNHHIKNNSALDHSQNAVNSAPKNNFKVKENAVKIRESFIFQR